MSLRRRVVKTEILRIMAGQVITLAAMASMCFTRAKDHLTDKSSDICLVELENRMVKEDRTALLEGVVLQAASPASHSSSITSPVVRLFTMDESFLLENH
ncbi:hypothetical protein Tco_1038337 [Tanacetum coccineum]